MFATNFSKRERYLALATVSVVIVFAVYALIIDPIAARWKILNSQVKSKISVLEKDSAILANQKALIDEYAKFSKYVKIPKSEEQAVADTLAYIENVSRNDSCFIINIKPAGVKNLESHKEVLIDVTAEAGGIDQFSKFLYDIENPRDTLIDIKRLTLSTKSNQERTLKGTLLISKTILD